MSDGVGARAGAAASQTPGTTGALGPWWAGHRGFTLIELLIVIAVVSVLMAFALANAGTGRDAANMTTLQGELVRLQQAMTDGYHETGQYPVGSATWTNVAAGGVSYSPNAPNVVYAVTVTANRQGATIQTGTPSGTPTHTCRLSIGSLASATGIVCN